MALSTSAASSQATVFNGGREGSGERATFFAPALMLPRKFFDAPDKALNGPVPNRCAAIVGVCAPKTAATQRPLFVARAKRLVAQQGTGFLLLSRLFGQQRKGAALVGKHTSTCAQAMHQKRQLDAGDVGLAPRHAEAAAGR